MILMLLYHSHVSLRQWWEFINHTCEQTADWANTLCMKPLSYALLREGDRKLNCGAESAQYSSVIIHFRAHVSYLLMQQLHCYSYYLTLKTECGVYLLVNIVFTNGNHRNTTYKTLLTAAYILQSQKLISCKSKCRLKYEFFCLVLAG